MNRRGFIGGAALCAAAGLWIGGTVSAFGAWPLEVKTSEPIPAALFGQNFAHTRAMVTGGLSAEHVANRKFAGMPRSNGVAQDGLALQKGGIDVVTAHPRGQGALPPSARGSRWHGETGGAGRAATHDDGSLYVTAYNPSVTETRHLSLPTGVRLSGLDVYRTET